MHYRLCGISKNPSPRGLGAGGEGHKSLPLTSEVLQDSVSRMEGRRSHGDVITGKFARERAAGPHIG